MYINCIICDNEITIENVCCGDDKNGYTCKSCCECNKYPVYQGMVRSNNVCEYAGNI
jgi:hypothetical protein